MQLRFFTLAINTLLLALAVPQVKPAPTPEPKIGYLRFWDMMPAGNGTFEIARMNAGAPDRGLVSASAFEYVPYHELPATHYRLGLFKQGDRSMPLQVFDFDLKAQAFLTILLSGQGGRVAAQLIDDTTDPGVTSATLTIRNFLQSGAVTVTAAGKQVIASLPAGQVFQASGFPAERIPIIVQTRLPNGNPAESRAEADFKASPRATLLIINDSYGRFRPRVTVDGRRP
jgi:hypothetical protein